MDNQTRNQYQAYLWKEIKRASKLFEHAQKNGMPLSAQYYQGQRFSLIDALNKFETLANLQRSDYEAILYHKGTPNEN